MEKCTKAYGGCNIRLVVWILLKRPTQVKKEDAIAISGSVWGLSITKSMGRREKRCLRGIHVLTALSASLLDFIRRGAPSLCARSAPLQGDKRKQRGDFVWDTFFIRCWCCFKHEKEIRETPYPKASAALVFLPAVLHQPVQGHISCPAEAAWAPSLPSTRLSPTLTERLRLMREGRESWRPDAGGQQWGQGTPSARAVLAGQAPTTETGSSSGTAGGWVYLADERKRSLQTPVNLQQALSPIQKVA